MSVENIDQPLCIALPILLVHDLDAGVFAARGRRLKPPLQTVGACFSREATSPAVMRPGDTVLAAMIRTHGSTYPAVIPAGMPGSRPGMASL